MRIKIKEENKLKKFKSLWEGLIFPSKSFGDFTITEYINSKHVVVQFVNTHNKVKTTVANIKTGYVRDKNARKVYGVGINDIGDTLDVNGKFNRAYQLWVDVIKRSHCPKFKSKNETYLHVTCSENWFLYSKFIHDIEKMTGYANADWFLDKDILSKGVKIYSSETCCFVPREINNLFTKRRKCRGEYPIGVSFYKTTLKFKSTVSVGGGKIHLGVYNTPEEAFCVYKREKEKYIKEVANKWKDQIDIRVYEALMSYEVSIYD